MGHSELEAAFQDFVKEKARGKKKEGDAAVVESLKRALEATTPDRPGRAQDLRNEKIKKEVEWI